MNSGKTRDVARDTEICRLVREEGLTQAEVARRFGICRQRVHDILVAYGVNYKNERRLLFLRAAGNPQLLANSNDPNVRSSAARRFIRNRFHMLQCSSKSKGIEFTIRVNDVVYPKRCPFLRIDLKYHGGIKGDDSFTYLRLDRSKGYVPGNVIVVSSRFRRLVGDGTANEHHKIAKFLDKVEAGVSAEAILHVQKWQLPAPQEQSELG